MSIPVFCSYIRRKDMDIVLNCLVRDSVGPGEYLDRFQKAAREALGYDYGFALRSPSEALGSALDTLGLSEGDPVAVPALAPAYYLKILSSRRLSPVLVDANPEDGTPDLDSFGSLNPKPKAFVLFESLGILPDPEAVRSLGVPTIEDISHSLGAYSGAYRAGSIGHLAFMGLEHGCLITSGGGGLLFAHGRREGTVLRNFVESLTAESRMTDYNAALGFAQLKEMEASIAKRRELAIIFAQSLARTRHKLVAQKGEGEPGFWALPVSLASGMKDVRAYAAKKEVETAPAFEKSIISSGLVPEGSCPNARSFLLRCLLFPLHQRIGAAGAQKIAKVLATLP
jgi:perosamine synthetase